MKSPKILILHTGGTFGMELKHERKGVRALIPKMSQPDLKHRFLERAGEIQDLARCEVEILFNLDSAHIGPPEWIQIAKKIQSKFSKYDGIVLIHGTDTLSYTAAALTYLLRPCKIPVVITGAQRPLAELRNDAHNNLVTAVEIAAHGPRSLLKQVSVVFGDRLFEGAQVRKKSPSDYAAFESPHRPPLAYIGTSIQYVTPPKRNSRDENQLSDQGLKLGKMTPNFSHGVIMIHASPGFPGDQMCRLIPGLQAVILIVFASGTGPSHLLEFKNFLALAKKYKVPIILTVEASDHAPNAAPSECRYPAGQDLLEAGCYPAQAMTPENAFVKTCLILGQPSGRKNFAKLWRQN